MGRPIALVGVAWMLAGCFDGQRAYDDYANRVVDAGVVDVVDGALVSELPSVDGLWLFAVRPNLPEDRILQFQVELTMAPVTVNTGLLDLTAQPLTVADRTPVGDAFVATDEDVRADATFEVPFEGMLPAAANPVSGSNAAVDALLLGQLRADDFMCGTMSGTAGALTLDGTTWAAVRIDGALPPPVFRCEDQPL